MIADSFAAGLRALRRRGSLALLVYGFNLVLAFVLALPLLALFRDQVGPTGFGQEMARGFDLVLFSSLGEAFGTAVGIIGAQLFWMIPLYLIWQAALGVGLAHALRGDQIRSFWEGVGRYTGRGMLLALCFLVPVAVWIVASVIGGGILSLIWQGEVGIFWINFVVVPTVLISGLAVLDMMHDYARIALVVDEKKVFPALFTGLGWPFKHGQASWLYLLWFVPAALLFILPTAFELNMAAASALTIWLLFLLQQVVLLLRAAVTVGWIGSEVALYETVRLHEAPLIAEEEEAVEPPEAAPVADDWAEPGGLATA